MTKPRFLLKIIVITFVIVAMMYERNPFLLKCNEQVMRFRLFEVVLLELCDLGERILFSKGETLDRCKAPRAKAIGFAFSFDETEESAPPPPKLGARAALATNRLSLQRPSCQDDRLRL